MVERQYRAPVLTQTKSVTVALSPRVVGVGGTLINVNSSPLGSSHVRLYMQPVSSNYVPVAYLPKAQEVCGWGLQR